jgi:hypothetical protein
LKGFLPMPLETPTIQNTGQNYVNSVDHRAEAVNQLRGYSEGIAPVEGLRKKVETLSLSEESESFDTSFWDQPTAEFDAPLYPLPEKTPAERIGEAANYMSHEEQVKFIAAYSVAIPAIRAYARSHDHQPHRQDYELAA